MPKYRYQLSDMLTLRDSPVCSAWDRPRSFFASTRCILTGNRAAVLAPKPEHPACRRDVATDGHDRYRKLAKKEATRSFISVFRCRTPQGRLRVYTRVAGSAPIPNPLGWASGFPPSSHQTALTMVALEFGSKPKDPRNSPDEDLTLCLVCAYHRPTEVCMSGPVKPSDETLARGSHMMRSPDASPTGKSLGGHGVDSAKNLYLRRENKSRTSQRRNRRGGRG